MAFTDREQVGLLLFGELWQQLPSEVLSTESYPHARGKLSTRKEESLDHSVLQVSRKAVTTQVWGLSIQYSFVSLYLWTLSFMQ